MEKKRFNYALIEDATLRFLHTVYNEYSDKRNERLCPKASPILGDRITQLQLPIGFLKFLPISGVLVNKGCKRYTDYQYFLSFPPTIYTAVRFIADFRKAVKNKFKVTYLVTEDSPEVRTINTTHIHKDTSTEIQKEIKQVKEETSLKLIEEINVKRFHMSHPEDKTINLTLEVDMIEKTFEITQSSIPMFSGKKGVSDLNDLIRGGEVLLKSLQQLQEIVKTK